MAITAMIRPAITAAVTLNAPTATPPANEPNAMPTLAAEAGNDGANAPPGPARLTTRYCNDGAIPIANRPEASTFTAVRNLLYAVEWWVFGLFAAFLWWRWTQDARAAERLPEAAEADPVPSDP